MPNIDSKLVTIKNVESGDVEHVVRDYRAVGAEIKTIPQSDKKFTLEIRINPFSKYLASGNAVLQHNTSKY